MLRAFISFYLFIYAILMISDTSAILFKNSSDKSTFNLFYDPNPKSLLVSIIIHFLFIFFLTGTIFFFRKLSFFSITKKQNLFSNFNRRNTFLVLLFTLLIFFNAIIYLYKVTTYGFINFIFQVRSGEQSIGGLMYIVMLSIPIVLLHKQHKIFKIALYIIMFLVNLLSGFRLILVWSIILLLFYAFVQNRIKINAKNIFLICFGAFLFFILGIVRELNQNFDGDLNYANYIIMALSSTNRSFPVTYLSYIIDNNIQFSLSGLWDIIVTPFLALIDYFIDINFSPYDTFEIKILSEKFFRDFLIFRQTPEYEASGFSLHFVPFFYSFTGIIGVCLIGILAGFMFLFSIKCIKSGAFYGQAMGILMMTFIYGCFESFSVSWGLFCYSAVVVIIFWFFDLFRHFFIKTNFI